MGSKDADYLLAKRLQDSYNREMHQADPNPRIRGLDDVTQTDALHFSQHLIMINTFNHFF